MKLRCIAVDDEPLALLQLEKYIERIPGLELAGTFLSGADALLYVEETGVDVMFLDIDMPDCSGLEVVRRLGDTAPMVIFTTAWPQYAIEGYRLDVVDYLLKPISFTEMEKAVEKALRRRSASLAATPEHDIFIKADGMTHKIDAASILYIKGLGEYVQIYLQGEKRPLTSLMSIKKLETELSPQGFMRLHKSWLVNLRHVAHANRTTVTVEGCEIPVGKKAQPAFLRYLKSRRLG